MTAPELDAAHYASADLVAEFRRLGVTITDQDLVSTEIPGRRWTIQDSNGQFRLQLAPGGQVDVFVAGKDLAPACLAGAICQAGSAGRAAVPLWTTPTFPGLRWLAACSPRST